MAQAPGAAAGFGTFGIATADLSSTSFLASKRTTRIKLASVFDLCHDTKIKPIGVVELMEHTHNEGEDPAEIEEATGSSSLRYTAVCGVRQALRRPHGTALGRLLEFFRVRAPTNWRLPERRSSLDPGAAKSGAERGGFRVCHGGLGNGKLGTTSEGFSTQQTSWDR